MNLNTFKLVQLNNSEKLAILKGAFFFFFYFVSHYFKYLLHAYYICSALKHIKNKQN